MMLRSLSVLLCLVGCTAYRANPTTVPEHLRAQPAATRTVTSVAVEVAEPAPSANAVELTPPQVEAPEEVADIPSDAEVTTTGLAYRILTPGSGARRPRRTSRVRVHYTGWTTDGERFDSSVARGQAIEFGLDQVIAGWTQGVQMMVEGETRRLWIPESLAYQGRAGAPAGMLVFDVQLIEIVRF